MSVPDETTTIRIKESTLNEGIGYANSASERKKTAQQVMAQHKLECTQKQVDEVVEIMKANVEKTLTADVKLSELEKRSDKIRRDASTFEQQTRNMESKFSLANRTMLICMGTTGVAIFIIFFYRLIMK